MSYLWRAHSQEVIAFMVAQSLRIYQALPVPLQHLAISAFGWQWKRKRFGGKYEHYRDGFIRRQSYTASEWRAYQTEALRQVLHIAMASVPYYQRAYAGLHLTEQRIRRFTLDDLSYLPILEKEAIRQRPQDFCRHGKIPRTATLCATSGSTGTPIQTWWTPDDFQRSLALREARSARIAGVSYALPRATVGGRHVVSAQSSHGPYYRFNWCEKQVYCSAFHLNARTAQHYVQAFHRHRVVWLTGYSHFFYLLACFMREQQLAAPPTLRAIITTSEPVTEHEREVIGRAFKCTVLQEYGTVEDVIYACEGIDGRMRVSPDAGILEIIGSDHRPAAPGEQGAVLGTGFICQQQLFIRYRIGDLAMFDPMPDHSGSHMPILKEIIGRAEDVIIGPQGQMTRRFHSTFINLPDIQEAQVIQDGPDHVRVHVVAPAGLQPTTPQEIVHQIQLRLSTAMRVEVVRVTEIPRNASGKFRPVLNLWHNHQPPGMGD